MNENNFKIPIEQIKDLITPMGFCMVSNKITVDGEKVGFMYREKPADKNDSGWRFLSGTETQDYVDDPHTSKIMDVNTVANYDQAIIPYLKMPFGTELERLGGTDEFIEIEN
ncbi:MAG TPA: DUF2185 domain-containing protein [Bacteroidales bacterium]|nr:DUF2185 domain-containing protein [Bacteroidales bacterium]